MPGSLAGAFLSHLSEELRASVADPDELDLCLEKSIDKAREDWPDFDVPPEEFAGYLADRMQPGVSVVDALLDMQVSDLFLACACVRGNLEAIAVFQKVVGPAVRSAIERAGASGGLVEDIEQRIWEILLVSEEGHQIHLCQYAGRARLRNWVGVIAARTAVGMRKKATRDTPSDQDELQLLADKQDDEEMLRLKSLYRKEFKTAFEQAIATLSSQERNLLRMYVLDDLSTPQIGKLYRVHATTASRWIADIRDTLFIRTRKVLMDQIHVSPKEFESIVGLIQSQFDVSIQRVLATPQAPLDKKNKPEK